MMPHLDGTREIVPFQECPSILLYKNVQYEEYPKHWHTSTEIIIPEKNGYQVICNGKTYELSVGDIMIVAPGVVHTMPAKKGTRYIFLVNFSSSITLKSFDSIFSLIQPVLIVSPKIYPAIYQACRDLIAESVDEYFSPEPFKEIAIYNNLLTLFLLVGRSYASQSDIISGPPAMQQEYIQKFMALCEYINDHCTEDLSMDSVASIAGFSKFHFSRLFKKFAGNTFYSYVNERRVAHAVLLLLNSEKSIIDIATDSGFNSISSFNRIFKISKACTPTEFRQMYNGENHPHPKSECGDTSTAAQADENLRTKSP